MIRRFLIVIAALFVLTALGSIAFVMRPDTTLAWRDAAFVALERNLLLPSPGQPESDLQSALAQAAGLPPGTRELTLADRAAITILAPGPAIDWGWNLRGASLDLDILRTCPNLITLNLTAVQGVDDTTIRQIGRVPSLEELIIDYPRSWCGTCNRSWKRGAVSDLTPLRALLKLRRLTLSGSSVTALGPVAGMSQLEFLDLSNNQDEANTTVIDLAPLNKLSRLEELRLNYLSIGDLSPLQGLPALEILHLMSDLSGVDLAPLLELPALQSVELSTYDLDPAQVRVLETLAQRGVQVPLPSIDWNASSTSPVLSKTGS